MSTGTGEFLELYLEEVDGLLGEVDQHLDALRSNPRSVDALQALRRVAHTLKTSAGLLGFDETRRYAAAIEAILSAVRQGGASVDAALLARLARAFSFLRAAQEHIAAEGSEDSASVRAAAAELAGGTDPDPTGIRL